MKEGPVSFKIRVRIRVNVGVRVMVRVRVGVRPPRTTAKSVKIQDSRFNQYRLGLGLRGLPRSQSLCPGRRHPQVRYLEISQDSRFKIQSVPGLRHPQVRYLEVQSRRLAQRKPKTGLGLGLGFGLGLGSRLAFCVRAIISVKVRGVV